MTKKPKRSKPGRPPSENPKGIHLGLRVDDGMMARLDRQIALEEAAKPGLIGTRSMMVRVLVTEALNVREKSKKGK